MEIKHLCMINAKDFKEMLKRLFRMHNGEEAEQK